MFFDAIKRIQTQERNVCEFVHFLAVIYYYYALIIAIAFIEFFLYFFIYFRNLNIVYSVLYLLANLSKIFSKP